MDDTLKNGIIATAKQEIEAQAEYAETQVREHIAELERLESEYGFDLEAFVAIYGQAALDGRSEYAQHLLAVWSALYAGVSEPDHAVGIYALSKNLAPGCYGFGKEAEYVFTESGVLSEGASSVEFRREDADGELRVSAVLVGSCLVSGFGEQDGVLTEVVLASNDSITERIRSGRSRFDGGSVVFSSPRGYDFFRAAVDTQHQVYMSRETGQYNPSRLAHSYFANFVKEPTEELGD